MNVFVTLVCCLWCFTVAGQIFAPQPPKQQQLAPNCTVNPTTNILPNPNSVTIGSTAQDVVDQTNRQAMKNMGILMPPMPPKDPYLAHQFILQQAQQYQTQQRHELQTILDELKNDAINNKLSSSAINANYTSADFIEKTKPYTDALQQLKDMLSGKQKLNVADAYYIMENTHGSTYISYSTYKTLIKQSADFIKTWMKQNKHSLSNNEEVHTAIQKFMSQKLSITTYPGTVEASYSAKTTTHLPFFYDYNDFEAVKDQRNSFVTKCFATGSGQCASMPVVYNILAEALGTKAYLTLAPQHAFVKYPNNTGEIENYEPTSNWKITDAWYADNMFVSQEARQSGIYLDTLNHRQMVADCILQLADAYMKKFGVADGKFAEDCIATAAICFPKNNFVDLHIMRTQLIKNKLYNAMQANNISDLKDVSKSKEAAQLLLQAQKNESLIKQLGYEEVPKGLYESMMEQQESGSELQKFKGLEGKQSRNLFIISK